MILTAALLGACGRAEEPGAAGRSRWVASPSDSTAPASPPPPPAARPAATDRAARRCVAPWSDVPAEPAAPAAQCPAPEEPAFVMPAGNVTFVDAPGRPAVSVEVARTDAHRARGLMYRTRLSEDEGMLFSWPAEQVRSFWMHNTCIPLDMLFVALDGTIVGILEQVPTMNDLPRRVPCPAAHVIEVAAGWSRSHGVRPGQKVEIEL